MKQLHGVGRRGLTCEGMSAEWNFCLTAELRHAVSSLVSTGNTIVLLVFYFLNGMQITYDYKIVMNSIQLNSDNE
jgi:hypothetical protein